MPDKMRSEPLLPQFPAISFVLHSRVKNIKGVLEQFDISVCQVAMDVVARIGAGCGGVAARFLADEGVTKNIAEHTMVCLADLSKQSVSVAATKLRLIKCLIHANNLQHMAIVSVLLTTNAGMQAAGFEKLMFHGFGSLVAFSALQSFMREWMMSSAVFTNSWLSPSSSFKCSTHSLRCCRASDLHWIEKSAVRAENLKC
jgi:hypothetical protein